MLIDPEFQRRKCAATGATSYDVEITPGRRRGTVIVCRRRLPTDGLPDFVRPFAAGGLELVETIEWSAARRRRHPHRRRHAGLHLAAAVDEGHAADGRRRRGHHGDPRSPHLVANVPLLGGRIEKACAPLVQKALQTEESVGRSWLAEHGDAAAPAGAAVTVAVAVAVILAACSARSTARAGGTDPGDLVERAAASARRSPAAPTSSRPARDGCPAGYAAPDPARPTVKLIFSVSDDLRTVHGTEHITFTPDLPITELVFRLTANTAPTVAAGNGITVTRSDRRSRRAARDLQRRRRGAVIQGGLLHIPFAQPIAAGTTVTADLTFDVTLGLGSFDRLGRATMPGNYAWFASAHPLLAWERGFGWHDEPMIQFPAESATSEAMQTDLTVVAPGADTVIMSGDPTRRHRVAGGSGRKTWHATVAGRARCERRGRAVRRHRCRGAGGEAAGRRLLGGRT